MSAILDELQDTFGLAAVGDRFLALRQQIANTGPLDTRERELAIVAGFVASHNELGVRVHCHRAIAAGATRKELEHVVILQLGATQGLSNVVKALRWLAAELGQNSDEDAAPPELDDARA